MFEGVRVMISGLMELETLTGTLRLCDGGFLDWPGRGKFVSFDPDFGTIGSLDAPAEQIGDESAGGRLTINVPSVEGAIDLAQAEMQGKPLRFWLAEVDADTGLMIGTPEKMFEGQVDTVSISLGQNDRTVVIEYVDAAERLFAIREGNVLTSRFHQTAWPGELGFDHCTGVGLQVPWGVSGPPRGTIGVGSNAAALAAGEINRIFGS
ncbi:MAG: hypothetical protein V4696_01480 [Pseudomonadota bacterium]